MRVKIESDVFGIVDRIKEIDEEYFIVFNTVKNKYELHNSGQLDSYCLTIPYDCLDAKIIDLIHFSKVENIDDIMYEIDNNNNIIENNNKDNVKYLTNYMAKEFFEFASNSSKKYDISKAFTSRWS